MITTALDTITAFLGEGLAAVVGFVVALGIGSWFVQLAFPAITGKTGEQLAADGRAKIVNRARTWFARPALRENLDFVHLGGRSTSTRVILGDCGYSNIPMRNIICTYLDEEHPIPATLKHLVEEFAAKQRSLQHSGQHYSYNGAMAHIANFSSPHDSDDEEMILQISLKKAEYYHFAVTTARLHADFQQSGFDSELRRCLIGDFNDWTSRCPPNLVNGLPINLIVTTSDSKLVLGKRSAHVSIAPGLLACPVNENFHLGYDAVPATNKLDIEKLAARGLKEEIGWSDFDYETVGMRSVTRILAFAVDVGTGNYGLIGYTSLPITFSELQVLFAKSTKDRFETEKLICIESTLNKVCQAVHDGGLYNFVGLALVMAFVHRNRQSWPKIDARFKVLQKSSRM